MAHWKFVHTDRRVDGKPLIESHLVIKMKDGRPEVLGEYVGGIHNALITMAHHFAPGDIVETPDGPMMVQRQTGESVN